MLNTRYSFSIVPSCNSGANKEGAVEGGQHSAGIGVCCGQMLSDLSELSHLIE